MKSARLINIDIRAEDFDCAPSCCVDDVCAINDAQTCQVP